jgi:hypothetical protein
MFFNLEQNMPCTSKKDSDDAKTKQFKLMPRCAQFYHNALPVTYWVRFLSNISAIVKDDISYNTVPGFRIKYKKDKYHCRIKYDRLPKQNLYRMFKETNWPVVKLNGHLL